MSSVDERSGPSSGQQKIIYEQFWNIYVMELGSGGYSPIFGGSFGNGFMYGFLVGTGGAARCGVTIDG